MRYFNEFEKLLYKFGNEESTVAFQNITSYVDVIDEIKDNASFYNSYTIPEGFRPDQLSDYLYGTPMYYWTFYLMNDHTRERGWPLTNAELEVVVKEEFDHIVITTKGSLVNQFEIGQTVSGSTSASTGTIVHRNLDLGQIMLTGTSLFTAGETATSQISVEGAPVVQSLVVTSSENEYNAAHRYENSDGETVDIDPAVGPGAQLTEITNWDNYHAQNEELKIIRIPKPELISQIVSSYKKAIRA